MASLDTRRPAAQEQLAVLGRQVGVDTLPIVTGQSAVQIARRAMEAARLGGYDVVMLDTAGRVTVDEALMAEAAEVRSATNPHEVLLVADALTGQDAVNTARAFDQRLGVTGIVLTRMDGDARGGAALSMRAVTGKPIKLIGTGEKVDALEEFHPSRVANRILGMGDIVSLVERAAENFDQAQAQRMADKMRKGKFDLEDLRDQLAQMEKLGGLGGLMGMLPGVAKMKSQLESANLDDRVIRRQRAIIDSMTPAERRNPDILKASRKKRIASGAGAKVEEINKLLKMHPHAQGRAGPARLGRTEDPGAAGDRRLSVREEEVNMLEWFLQKSQVDLGNLAVGIGTAMLAFASFRSIQYSRAQQEKQEVAKWRETLREVLAAYHSSCVRLSALRRGIKQEDRNRLTDADSKSVYAEMTALRSQVMLMLDDNRAEHVPLLEQCNLLQKAAFEGQPIQAQDFTRTARSALRA
jgi:hypothetical protein